MKHLYQTPNSEYRIYKQRDSLWTNMFSTNGMSPVCFYVARFDKPVAEWNQKYPEANLSDYIIIQAEESIDRCLKWLHKRNIISQDELDYQIKKFSEINVILPLTNE